MELLPHFCPIRDWALHRDPIFLAVRPCKGGTARYYLNLRVHSGKTLAANSKNQDRVCATICLSLFLQSQPTTMKITRRVLLISGIIITFIGIAFYFHWFEQPVFKLIAYLLRHPAKSSWPLRFHQFGIAFLGLGPFLVVISLLISAWSKFKPSLLSINRAFQAWLDHNLGKFLDYRSQEQPVKFSWPSIKWLDWIILAAFLIYASLLFIGEIQGNFPNFLVSGDSGNTASFAAGFDHPTLFKGDMLLNQTSNIAVYSTFNVYFMRWLAPYVGSY